MEHSTAIMEDAGKAIDGEKKTPTDSKPDYDAERQQHSDNRTRKRKADFPSDRLQHGSRGRGGGRNDGKRHQKGDMGRGEYFRDGPDRRQRTDDQKAKNEKREAEGKTSSVNYGVTYTKEEIDSEERKPKRKVAVLIGYSGTGYKGMQITPTERTIEGDLFQAFIKAGAISKANADDPKKAGLVRCARTDKGVHAAGNMISLKLIVEEPDIVEKINAELSTQIRVWGIERTIGSFSCYQACDSRWYEYLIPSHAFLPPHPSSWLAKKLEELADEAGDRKGYESRQEEVKGFWENVDETVIKKVLEGIDEDIRWDVVKALQGEEEAGAKVVPADADGEAPVVKAGKAVGGEKTSDNIGTASKNVDEKTEEAVIIIQPEVNAAGVSEPKDDKTTIAQQKDDTISIPDATVDSAISLPHKNDDGEQSITRPTTETKSVADTTEHKAAEPGNTETMDSASTTKPTIDRRPTVQQHLSPEELDRLSRLRQATKQLRQAYITAKRQYRIPQSRITRIQSALSKFVGTSNYHNYTVSKTFRDPSAKRHIKSFVVEKKPILIGEGDDAEKSEWLSLKVHGQSFMMHQIRKMIGMVCLLVRSGSSLSTMNDSMGAEKYSIPKVPGLGLLLERPVFDSYNDLQAVKHGREKLLFSKHEDKIREFKEREIYQRIFREEEERNEFGRFFNHVDHFKEPYFLYVSSKGLAACKGVNETVNTGASGKGKEKAAKQVAYESDGDDGIDERG
ncbi:tRNA pseudouridine synthase 1 [Elasticomyces elasticus]|nr:tRNA pseudouridine synthase 1 [Elasticomyces elasticus]